MASPQKVVVRLTDDQRQTLTRLVRTGTRPAAMVRRAQVLLRAGRQYRKLGGSQEAKLVALACSNPPQGRARWTMTLLADRLVELQVVESIDPATVWRTLEKTRPSRGSSSSGSSRPRRAPRS